MVGANEEEATRVQSHLGGRAPIRKLKRVLSFGKPKGPGVAINQAYYLSVLAAKAQLPNLLQVLNPKGEGGAVPGLGAPMAEGASKKDLAEPIKRGVYALSSPDQKSVLKLMVLPKEEAGFDPSSFARSELAQSWDPELRLRVESTWIIMQLTFESYDPAVYPALDFFLSLARRLADLTDGVVADPVSQVYRLPSQVFSDRPAGEQIAAADHVQVHHREHGGALHVYTLGLVKFDHPEVEVYGVRSETKQAAYRFMVGLSQSVLKGARLEPGATVGLLGKGLKVAVGGLDRAVWDGIPCLELIPDGNVTTDDAVKEWLRSVGS
jgi:hypothetical protein